MMRVIACTIGVLLLFLSLVQSFKLRNAKLGVRKSTGLFQQCRSTSSLAGALSSAVEGASGGSPSFTFVGGKGGVGKTSSSSAIALSAADKGLRTLLVSTDPAHSLGDALGVSLPSGQVTPIVTETNLWALELSVDEAMDEFRGLASGLEAESLASALGVPKEIIDSFGLDDLTSIFANPPPGIDEIVALTKIFKYAREKDEDGRSRYDKIIIDTAPTGHTLRLLQLPTFLGNLTGQLIKFRGKIQGAISAFKGMFGGGADGASEDKIGGVLGRLEELQDNMAALKKTLMDSTATQFVVVTIPTALAVAESRRLVASLKKAGISVGALLCNQVVAEDAGQKYLQTRRRGQQACMSVLQGAALAESLEITEVPYFDTEITGLYGLRYFADIAHPPLAKTATNPIDSRKLSIFGGKGGVGKTTTAASWAVRLSDSGMKTLVVSTDPAHSLGDALGMPLSAQPVLLDSAIDGGGGELWAMEVDPVEAMGEFRDTLKSTLGSNTPDGGVGGGMGTSMGIPDLKAELTDMLSGEGLADTPGADEVVALTKVVTFLQEGITQPNGQVLKFDRVVLDTAPTGHTMRMLTLPEFLIQFVQKVKKVRDKTSVFDGMIGSTSADAYDDIATAVGGTPASETGSSGSAPSKEDKLVKFEDRMKSLQSMLHDAKMAEFTVVTIPTEVAVSETTRLLDTLEEEKIACRRLVVNQMVTEEGSEGGEELAKAYLDRLRRGQSRALADLTALAAESGVELATVPFFDNELRTVFGLRMIAMALQL